MTHAYFADLLANDGPVAKVIQYKGKKKTVHFRKVTGAERIQLAGDHKIAVGKDKGPQEVSLGAFIQNRHMLVQFTNVTDDGTQVFNNLAEVQGLPEGLINALATAADEVNSEDDAGKS